jgi:hypothetical protein
MNNKNQKTISLWQQTKMQLLDIMRWIDAFRTSIAVII